MPGVLKIILIVLICIVAAAVAALLLVLFFPVSYQMHIFGKNEDISVDLHARWLFGAASFRLKEEQRKIRYKICVFGIALKEGSGALSDVRIKQKSADAEEAQGDAPKPEEDGFIRWIQKRYENVRAGIEKAGKIKHIMETKTGQNAWKTVRDGILQLHKCIKPFIIKGKISYGLGDAHTTAILYGFLGDLAYRLGGEELVVFPDFLEKGIEPDVRMKGRFRIRPVLSIISRTVSDERVKRTYRVIRRIINV